MIRFGFLTFLIAFSFVMMGCPKKHSSPSQGGEDSSGGTMEGFPSGGVTGEGLAGNAGIGVGGDAPISGEMAGIENIGGDFSGASGGEDNVGGLSLGGTIGLGGHASLGGAGGIGAIEQEMGGVGGELPEISLPDYIEWPCALDEIIPNECGEIPVVESRLYSVSENHDVLWICNAMSAYSIDTACDNDERSYEPEGINQLLGLQGRVRTSIVKWIPQEAGLYAISTGRNSLERPFRFRILRDCQDEDSVVFDSETRAHYEGMVKGIYTQPRNDRYRNHVRIRLQEEDLNEPLYFMIERHCEDEVSSSGHVRVDLIRTDVETEPRIIQTPQIWLEDSSLVAQKDLYFVIHMEDPNMRASETVIRFFEEEDSVDPLPTDLPFEKEFRVKLNPTHLITGDRRYPQLESFPYRGEGFVSIRKVINQVAPYYWERAQYVELELLDEENISLGTFRVRLGEQRPIQAEGEVCYPEGGFCIEWQRECYPTMVLCEEGLVCREAEDRAYRCTASTQPEIEEVRIIEHPDKFEVSVRALDETFDVEHVELLLLDAVGEAVTDAIALPRDYTSEWSLYTREAGRQRAFLHQMRIDRRSIPDAFEAMFVRVMDSSGHVAEQRVDREAIVQAITLVEGEACDVSQKLNRCSDGTFCLEREGEAVCTDLEKPTFASIEAVVDQEAKHFEITAEFEAEVGDNQAEPWGLWLQYDLVDEEGAVSIDSRLVVFGEMQTGDDGAFSRGMVRSYWPYRGVDGFGSPPRLDMQHIRASLVDRKGVVGLQVDVPFEEGEVLEPPYLGCVLDRDCEEGLFCENYQFFDFYFVLGCMPRGSVELTDMEVWLTDGGRSLVFDVQGQNPFGVYVDSLHDWRVRATHIVTGRRIYSQRDLIFNRFPPFLTPNNVLEVDEVGNFHWELIENQDFFVDGAERRNALYASYLLGNFNPLLFYSMFNHIRLRIAGAGDSVSELERSVQFAEVLEPGSACDALDFRRECGSNSVCADPDEDVFGDGECTPSEDMPKVCPPDILYEDMKSEPLFDEQGRAYWESSMPPVQNFSATRSNFSFGAPRYEYGRLSCRLIDGAFRVYRFVAPEAGPYVFSIPARPSGSFSTPIGMALSLRSHCADFRTEFACSVNHYDYAMTPQTLVSFLEAGEEVFVYYVPSAARDDDLGRPLRVYPYEPPPILPNDETPDGEQVPIALFEESSMRFILLYTKKQTRYGPSGFARGRYAIFFRENRNAFKIQFLDEGGRTLETEDGVHTFVVRENLYLTEHSFDAPVQSRELLEEATHIRVWPGTWLIDFDTPRTRVFSDESVVFPIQAPEPEVIAVGERCPSNSFWHICEEGSFCAFQQDAALDVCALQKNRTNPPFSYSNASCITLADGCSLDECPDHWTEIELSAQEYEEVEGERWYYEGSLAEDEREGRPLEFHGIGDCVNESQVTEATGFNDLFSFTAPTSGRYRVELGPLFAHLSLALRRHCIMTEKEQNSYCNMNYNRSDLVSYRTDTQIYEFELAQNQTVYFLVDSFTADDRKAYSLTVDKLEDL